MISWTPTTVHSLASGRFMAFTELLVDGQLLRTGKGVTEASTYIVAKQGLTQSDAIAKTECEKSFLLNIAKRDGKI